MGNLMKVKVAVELVDLRLRGTDEITIQETDTVCQDDFEADVRCGFWRGDSLSEFDVTNRHMLRIRRYLPPGSDHFHVIDLTTRTPIGFHALPTLSTVLENMGGTYGEDCAFMEDQMGRRQGLGCGADHSRH